MTNAHGGFEVEITRDSDDDSADGTVLGSLKGTKRFHGDLEGSSRGRMLTGMTAREGSAGYVLIERVQGRLQGRTGSFLLQHFGIMDRGVPRLTIEVIPDSGTDELAGIQGRMTIQVSGADHSYDFEFSFVGRP
ncbi:MAG: DUF3224 domain-containing protein [Thermoplasmata archaeon]